MLLNLLLNSAVELDRSPASLSLKVLLNAKRLSAIRVKVKCLKEVGHTQLVGHKSWSYYKVPEVGRINSVALKDLI